jgi:hypothetical protein
MAATLNLDHRALRSHPYGEVPASPAESAVLNLSLPSTAAPAPGGCPVGQNEEGIRTKQLAVPGDLVPAFRNR